MTQPLSVNPNELRAAAANLADVSSQMKQVLSSLNAQLATLGSPWGNDSIGDGFANGSSGYLAQVDQVNSSIKAETQILDSLSQSLTTSANNFQQADQQPGPTSGGGAGNVLATNVSGGSAAAGPVVSAGPGQPAQPPTVAGKVATSLVAPGPVNAGPVVSAGPGQPAQPPTVAGKVATFLVAPGPAGPVGPVNAGPVVSAGPGQPAQPPTVAGNVLASGVPTGGASGPASGIGALMQVAMALVQPAGEGVSAAMGAVQGGAPNGGGAPGDPASRGQVPGVPAGRAVAR
jgi:WXG100 family type VII secretion target